jgi:hypothetical protein
MSEQIMAALAGIDGRDWFRAVTAGLLDDPAEDNGQPKDRQRYVYVVVPRHGRDVAPMEERIMRSIAARSMARAAVQPAKARAQTAAPPGGLGADVTP